MTKLQIIELEVRKRKLTGVDEFDFIQKCLKDESFYTNNCLNTSSSVYDELSSIIFGSFNQKPN